MEVDGRRQVLRPGVKLAQAATAIALFAVAGLVAVRVHGGAGPTGVDVAASRIVGSARLGSVLPDLVPAPHWASGVVSPLVGFGFPVVAAALELGLAFLAWRRRDGKGVVLCLLGPAVAMALTEAVGKPLVGRHLGRGLAYPSGHATGAAAVAVVALVLGARWGGRRALVWFGPVVLLLPVLTGVALVRFGWHYPTDVLGGTAVGAATVFAAAAVLGSPRPSDLRGPSTSR